MTEHKTERESAWTASTSTQRTLYVGLIVCAAVLLVLELIDFDPPLSLVGIGIYAGMIGVCLYELRKTYRPVSEEETEPGRLERVMSLGISLETVKGRLLNVALWMGFGLLTAFILTKLLG